MLLIVLRLFARLPLALVHAAGTLVGWAVYLADSHYRDRLRENLRQSHCYSDFRQFRTLLRKSIAHAGKGLCELPVLWFGKNAASLVIQVDNWQLVEQAQAVGKGIIFLTPHLGCFDISALYAAKKMPLTVLYREPKRQWLRNLVIDGRQPMQLAPANLQGVKKLYQALKAGGAIGLLPDQAPGAGEGVWCDFFGRPAYTMTLVSRLAEARGATVIMAFAKRLPRGQGYHLMLYPMPEGPLTPETMNREIEKLVASCPEQYLWSYNRYKVPAGAAPRSEAC